MLNKLFKDLEMLALRFGCLRVIRRKLLSILASLVGSFLTIWLLSSGWGTLIKCFRRGWGILKGGIVVWLSQGMICWGLLRRINCFNLLIYVSLLFAAELPPNKNRIWFGWWGKTNVPLLGLVMELMMSIWSIQPMLG